jgi:hypothetical protein
MLKERSVKIVNTKSGNTLANLHPLSTVFFGSGFYLITKKTRVVGKQVGAVSRPKGVVKKIKEKIITPIASPESSPKSSFGAPGDILKSSPELTGDILTIIFVIIALYMVYKCTKTNQAGFMQILVAVCFSPAYIVYRLIKPC